MYAAVARLLLSRGVRSVTMREAADATCMSIGGLHHYFPDKRALVLWPITSGWSEHQCVEWYVTNAGLRRADPERFVQAFVDS